MQMRRTLQTWVLGFLIRENNGKAPCLCSFGIGSEFPISRRSLCQMQILIYPLEVAVRHMQTRLPCWAGKLEPHGLLCRVTCRLQGRKISSVTAEYGRASRKDTAYHSLSGGVQATADMAGSWLPGRCRTCCLLSSHSRASSALYGDGCGGHTRRQPDRVGLSEDHGTDSKVSWPRLAEQ